MTRMRTLSIIILAVITLVPAHAVPVNWEPSFGTNLNLGDDQSLSVSLGFSFPFQGSTYSSVFVSSNGFISLGGDNGDGCCEGTLQGDPVFGISGFLDGSPRIAPAWFDMISEVDTANNVYLNASAGRAVFTWNNLTEWGGTARNTFQVQLLADGSIIFSYLTLNDTTLTSHKALIGITSGGGVADPGETDLLGGLLTSNLGTHYMFLIPSGAAGASFLGSTSFNLDNVSIVFRMSQATEQPEVPEPGTIGLCIIGLGGGIAFARRGLKN